MSHRPSGNDSVDSLIVLIEAVGKCVFWGFVQTLGRKQNRAAQPRVSFAELVRIAKAKRTNRRIQRLIRHGIPSAGIPDIGLTCRACGYSLTGLHDLRCPECGGMSRLEDHLHLYGAGR